MKHLSMFYRKTVIETAYHTLLLVMKDQSLNTMIRHILLYLIWKYGHLMIILLI